jgi:hypothetical protein
VKIDGVTVISEVADAHYGGEDVPDEVTHPETGEVVATTRYHSTDAWRGYWEVDPAEGWKKVGEGCNCGDWGDTPPGTSNAECEAQIRELVAEHGEVTVVLCGGSNLFALQFDCLARKKKEHAA